MGNIINIGPLPVYTDINQQNRHKEYAFGNISPLISPVFEIPQFQFIYTESVKETDIGRFLIYKMDSYGNFSQYDNVSSSRISPYIEIEQHTSHTSIRSKPFLNQGLFVKEQGCYYFEVHFNFGIFISEIWSCCDVTNCVKLSYTNSRDLVIKNFPIRFGAGVYEPSIYLNTGLGRPEYSFEEEVTERLGYKFIESQVSKKIYKFSFLAAEFLLDALRIVRLCDTRTCTYKGKEYDMITFDLDSSWEEQGDLASVDAEFETDNIITNLGGMQDD